MKQRSKDYMDRKKAYYSKCHPTDLKSLLIAEYDSSNNLIVKKDIMHMITKLDETYDQTEANIPSA